MRKAVLLLLVSWLAAVPAFADGPKFEPRTSALTAQATGTIGYDIDNGFVGLSNTNKVYFYLDMLSQGASQNAGDEDIWGEISVYSDNNNVRYVYDGKAAGSSGDFQSNMNFHINYAKVHFGQDAYLGLVVPGANLAGGDPNGTPQVNFQYLATPPRSFEYKSWGTGRYAPTADNTGAGLFAPLASLAPVTVGGGLEFGASVPDLVDAVVDVGTMSAWDPTGATTVDKQAPNAVAYKVKLATSVVPTLGFEVGYSGAASSDQSAKYDSFLGSKVEWTLPLDDNLSLVVPLGVTMVQTVVDGAMNSGLYPYVVGAIQLRTGARQNATEYVDSTERDATNFANDWAFFPGATLAVSYKNAGLISSRPTQQDAIGIHLSYDSGTLFGDTISSAAFEVDDINSPLRTTGVQAGVKTSVPLDSTNLIPQLVVNWARTANGNQASTNTSRLNLKAELLVSPLFQNTDFEVRWDSNDFLNGAPTDTAKPAGDQKWGKVETSITVKF